MANFNRNRRGKPNQNKIFSAVVMFIIAFTIFNNFIFLKLLFMALGAKKSFEYFQENQQLDILKNQKSSNHESRESSRRFERRQEPKRSKYKAPRRSDSIVVKNKKEKEKNLKEGKQLFNNFAYEEAAEKFASALKFAPNDIAVNFNLACTYSLLEKQELSFKHLNVAIANGFTDIEKIETHDALAYIRITDEFAKLKENGFKPSPVVDNNLLHKLEKLKTLRDEGILTEIEFLEQKQKLLKN